MFASSKLFAASLLSLMVAACAPNAAVPPSAANLPPAERVVLAGSATSAQKTEIQGRAAARFGGFKGMAWGRSGVSGMIVVAVNGQAGPNRYYDSRGSFNGTWDGSFSIVAQPGQVKITGKPNHYQISDHREHVFGFRATPGHDYFLGTIVDDSGGQFRWVPVVYDKTAGKVIDLPGVEPQSAPKPVTATIYL